MASEPNKVIVERSGGNSMVALVALLVIALIAIGAYVVIQKENANNTKDNAIAGAAKQVGDAADDVGDAAKDAVKK